MTNKETATQEEYGDHVALSSVIPNFLSTLLSQLSEGVVVTDANCRIIYSNEAFHDITGYSKDEIANRTCAFLQGPETDRAAADAINDAVSHERIFAGEILNYRKSGEIFWNDLTVTPIRGADQETKLFLGITRDITEKKIQSIVISDIEHKYRFMLDHMRAGIVLHKANTEIIYANAVAEEILGVKSNDMIGAINSDERWRFVGEDGFELPIERYPVNQAVAARREVNDVLLGNYRVSDGKLIWFLCNAYPVFDAAGDVDRVIVSFVDVTGLRQAHARLRESEERYRLLADNAHDLILRYDAEGRVVYVSPSFRRYGFEPEAMIGNTVGFGADPQFKSQTIQRFRDTLAGKPQMSQTLRAVTPDGRQIWFESQMAAFHDASGAIVGVISAIRDVTDRVAAETALREVNAELIRVNRISALGVYAASLAHEINQPLAALAANAEAAFRWLTREPPDMNRALEAVKRSERDARRASDIVGRMRAMVTKGAENVTEFSLHDAIREIVSLTRAEQRRTHVDAKLELSTADLLVSGDRIQIQQVVLNLLLNALEAMADTPAESRRLYVRSALADNGDIQVEVEDRGCGIDPATADRIFDRLFTTKSGGTGLGLAISKSIVEAHGGRIWVEPAEPHGAIFRFQLARSDKAGRPA